MKSYISDKPVVRDAKEPVLMLMCGTEQPIMAHIVAGEVWLTEFDVFFDAGFEGNCRFIPVDADSCHDKGEDAYFGWICFMEDGEIGEPISREDSRNRLKAFKDIFEAFTKEVLIIKEVA